MKTKRKALLLAFCAVLLVAASVLGTLAYLTDETESVTNTFSVGNVAFGDLNGGLDEAEVNKLGERLDTDGNVWKDGATLADRVTSNSYFLIPGHVYTKDPVVHLKNSSVPCYVFITVDNGLTKTIDGKEVSVEPAYGSTFKVDGHEVPYIPIAGQILAYGWQPLSEGSNIYWQKWDQGVDQSGNQTTEGTTDLGVFDGFVVNKSLGNDDLAPFENATVVVKAYAIQQDGFDNAQDAWDSVYEEYLQAAGN